MAHSISATAPGKIILFGEHSVVYGQPALAIPVTQVEAICTISNNASSAGLKIVAPDLGQSYHLKDASKDNPTATVIWHTLSALKQNQPPHIKLAIRSTIPIARGLGSGAAISTSIVKALSAWLSQPLSPQQISDIVFEVEKLYHGTPSGIDNSVVAFAQPIFFIKGEPIAYFKVGTPLNFVIGDTGIKSPTYKAVGDLRQRWQAKPDHYEPIFKTMGNIAIAARQAIEAANKAEIGALMQENHSILDEIGISNPLLNKLVFTATEAGALGAKLSGAGWGGNMIALVEADKGELVAEALIKAGAVNTIITVLA